MPSRVAASRGGEKLRSLDDRRERAEAAERRRQLLGARPQTGIPVESRCRAASGTQCTPPGTSSCCDVLPDFVAKTMWYVS
jgi:hypothetical protein